MRSSSSATYGWQTVFNSFGALAIATPIFGLPMAIFLRIFNNAFGSLYALAFDSVITKVRTLFEEKESASPLRCRILFNSNHRQYLLHMHRFLENQPRTLHRKYLPVFLLKSIHHRIIFFFKIVHDHFFSIRIYQPILSHSGGHILVQLKHQILLLGHY